VEELQASRKEELEQRNKQKAANKSASRYEDQSEDFQVKPKVYSLAELLDLLRLELDDQRRLSRPVMQRMEELKVSSSSAEQAPSVNAITWRTAEGDVSQESTFDQEDDPPLETARGQVLQAFAKPSYGGRPSSTGPVDKSKWVCSRKLSGLPCPDKDGKLCEGHNNNNPDDKAAYIARQLPIVQEKIRWFKEREVALLKSQKEFPARSGPANKHLSAMTYALDPEDEYHHALLRERPSDSEDLDPPDYSDDQEDL
jgi:hypothetical protein